MTCDVGSSFCLALFGIKQHVLLTLPGFALCATTCTVGPFPISHVDLFARGAKKAGAERLCRMPISFVSLEAVVAPALCTSSTLMDTNMSTIYPHNICLQTCTLQMMQKSIDTRAAMQIAFCLSRLFGYHHQWLVCTDNFAEFLSMFFVLFLLVFTRLCSC